MASEKNQIAPEELPFDFDGMEDTYGEIIYAELECPGVYYITTVALDELTRQTEYYVITDEAQAISTEARRYGLRPQGRPNLLLYECGKDSSGWMIIRYEIYKYLTAHQMPLPEGDSLYDAAYCGMELHSEYFGAYPVPAITPTGYTTRHRQIDNGIYWIETDQCRQFLAVCNLFCEELSESAHKLGLETRYDIENGLNRTSGYLFFPKEIYAIPLFELMRLRQWDTMVDKTALMNFIWLNFPVYAASYNVNEQTEQANGLTFLSEIFDASDDYEDEAKISPKNMIAYTEYGETEFLTFLR